MPVYDLKDFHVRAHLALFTRWPVADATNAPASARRRTHDRFDHEVDPDNKVVKARVKINNPGNKLKPEMFANVTIKAKSGESLPEINTRALIFDNDKNYVVVVDGKAKVHVQQVDIAKRVEDRAYIRAGLKPGDRVVASRQLYLFESLRD